MHRRIIALLLTLLLALPAAVLAESKPATLTTREANQAWYEKLDFSDEREKENALRGLIEAPERVVITREDGVIAWNLADFDFVRDVDAPDTQPQPVAAHPAERLRRPV